jgi:multicomponent Na+:H+ antiporter subunit G
VETVREVLTWLFVVPGAAFCVIGALGLLRLPEFYSRMHAAGVTDTMGAALVLIGLMLQPADWTVTVKLAVILFFVYVTSPTAAHALIHAAYSDGLQPELADDAPPVPERRLS